MRPLVRVLRRSKCVAFPTRKTSGKDAVDTIVGGLGCFQAGNHSIGMGMHRKCTRPLPIHVPLRWSSSNITQETALAATSSSDITEETAVAATTTSSDITGETVVGVTSSDMLKEIAAYAALFMHNHPEIVEVAAYSAFGCFLFVVFPRVLRKLRKESVKYIEYEKCLAMSLLNTQQEIMKYYPMASVSLTVFSEMSTLIAPSMIDYLPQLWMGASIVAILSFFNILKQSFINEAKKGDLIDLNWLSRFDKFASGGLIALGLLGFAEVSGLSLQSLMTISGLGGVLTAFAGRDILGNMLNGINLHITEPFIVGEYIKAGSVEGTVVDIGLTCTSLMNGENLPITVPNSYFLSQVIMNRSRASVRSCVRTIPIKFGDIDRIVALTSEVTFMLKNKPMVTLKGEGPSCFVSRVGKLYGELVISCETHVEQKGLAEFEQDILLETLRIMKSNEVEVGDPLPSGDLEVLLEAAKLIRSRESSAYSG